MCMFSGPVADVNTTRIFARADKDDGQFLVYSMRFESKKEVAMVLPLPVKAGAGEKAVSFINLKDYQDFFEDLEKGFPVLPPVLFKGSRGIDLQTNAAAVLEVFQVGDFEASFVPTMKDFERLDERFRLPPGTWQKLPGYKDYGFAVFKLKRGKSKVHPMAFSFPRRDAKSLFFPTVHIHDGKVHAQAHFDHALYCQPSGNAQLRLDQWRESVTHARNFMKLDKAAGLLEPNQHCYRKELSGDLPNRDTLIEIEI
jgi:hypothetical protein